MFTLLNERFGGHGKPHVSGAVNEFKDRTGSLVGFERFDAQDACVAAWAVGVAEAEFVEEFREMFFWFLLELWSIGILELLHKLRC